jgi:hypothetical protein
MKKLSFIHFQNVLIVLMTFALLFSCNKFDESGGTLSTSKVSHNPHASGGLKDAIVYDETVDCNTDCIDPESGNYYVKSEFITDTLGQNIKKVSYNAYNTEELFTVNVLYEIIAGPSNAKAKITIDIQGDYVEFKNVEKGTTVTHTMMLPEGWQACDEIPFSVTQSGLGNPMEFSNTYGLISICPSISVGDFYQGGIVAYLFNQYDPGYVEGEIHGLIAAPYTFSERVPWGCLGTVINGTSMGMGTGLANTIAIVNGCSESGIAARICYDLEVNGYNDWYLPSGAELFVLFNSGVYATTGVFFWGSTGPGANVAWVKSFSTSGYTNKSGLYWVRAARSF